MVTIRKQEASPQTTTPPPGKTRVEFQILGEKYRLVADGSAEEAERVVNHLNGELTRLQAQNPTLSRTRLAVLAALNLTEALLRLQGEYDSLLDYLTRNEDEEQET